VLKLAICLVVIAVGTTAVGIPLGYSEDSALVQASSMILIAAAACWVVGVGLLVVAGVKALLD
jgi:hypothetical protein